MYPVFLEDDFNGNTYLPLKENYRNECGKVSRKVWMEMSNSLVRIAMGKVFLYFMLDNIGTKLKLYKNKCAGPSN